MQTVMIVGAGKGGLAILQLIKELMELEIKVVVDVNPEAPGIEWASLNGIETASDWRPFMDQGIDIIIEVTGQDVVYSELLNKCTNKQALVPASVAFVVAKLFNDKTELMYKNQHDSYKHNLIFNATNDGMIVIDSDEKIMILNKSAEKMIGIQNDEWIGKPITQIISSSRLPRVLRTRKAESNQQLMLNNGLKVISTRIPIIDEHDHLIGGIAIFKDITEAVRLAEQITDLREIQTKLQAIFTSSDEAISVVDENGRGIMINPAYTRITGLTEEQVIGMPATTDISEGESVHMKVLLTRRAVRGVQMRVGINQKEVIVNGAPIIVDGKLKGSVCVIHDVSEIKHLNRELNRARQIIRTLEAKYSFADIIGTSEEIKIAIEQANLAAKTPATILLRGESGTGKELFAHAIHDASDRKYNKFIRVNCAALSESILESELFGYEEGAFSGAKRGGKKGLFEEANNGSIFLDEIGELTINTQAKLLRVLQEHEITRVGGTQSISLNVRVIAATNINLEKGMVNGSFREDLYYRLNRMPIQIPPLRKRKEDIEKLCLHLIRKINQEYGRNVEGLTNSAIESLKNYDWPGNVRELDNILGRAMILMNYNEKLIDTKHLPELNKGAQNKHKPSLSVPTVQTLAERIEVYEKHVIEEALKENNGNKTITARSLGLSVRNLYYKLEKYNLAKNSMQ